MPKLPSLVLLAAVSACAGQRPYVAPTANLETYARVTIRNAAGLPLSVRLYETR